MSEAIEEKESIPEVSKESKKIKEPKVILLFQSLVIL